MNFLSFFKISKNNHALRHWKLQRLSAVFLLLLLFPWSIIIIFNLGDFSYNLSVSLIKNPIIFLYLNLIIIFTCFHSKLGIEIIIEDYVNNKALQYQLLALSLFIHFFIFFIGIFSLFNIFLGSGE